MTIITKKYADTLIRAGCAAREYGPLVRCTRERELDNLYAVLRRVEKDGEVHYDHYLA